MRAKLKERLSEVLNKSVSDVDMIICLMGVCAHAFAYPDKYSTDDKDLFREAYVTVSEKGGIAE